MANTIKIKNSGTTANVPSAASLQYGELALNYIDGKLYFKTGTSTVDFLKANITLGTDTSGNYMSGISGTSPVSVSHTPAEGSSATVSLASGYGDTLNPYASKTANYVLASPSGSAGVPTFRALLAADIPTLNQNTTGTAATVTGAAQTAITSVGTLTGLGVNSAVTISSASYSSTFGTSNYVTATAHGLTTGDTVTVAGCSPSSWNRTATITVANSTQFYFSLFNGSTGGAYVASSGTVTGPTSLYSNGQFIGIGTASPTTKLTVVGTVTATAFALVSLFATMMVLTLYTLPLDAGLLNNPISAVVDNNCVLAFALISDTLTILGAAI